MLSDFFLPRVGLLIFGACVLVTGCSFHRTVINEGVRDLDPSFIVVGKTTWLEVLKRFGPPNSDPSTRHLKYTCSDSRSTEFEGGYVLQLPYLWSDDQLVEELLVEFDTRGVVSDAYRIKRHVVRPPFQGEGSRQATVTTQLARGSGS